MPGKLFVFSTKTENMRVVLERMAYGADVTRPEQRGLLSARPGDLALLFDIDRRLLMGPFELRTGVHYASSPLWSNERWRFVVGLRPAGLRVGLVGGRDLLDLVVERGVLSLRDTFSLISYWIHTAVLGEADGFLDGFLSKARFTSLERLLAEYGARGPGAWWEPAPHDPTLGELLCTHALHGGGRRRGPPPEYAIEAALAGDPGFTRSLVPLGGDPLVATGVYVYSQRFLDIAAYTVDPLWFTVVEVKAAIPSQERLAEALDQASHYAYAVAKAFNIPKGRLMVAVATTSLAPAAEAGPAIDEAAARYGLRRDLYTVIEVGLDCSDGHPRVDPVKAHDAP